MELHVPYHQLESSICCENDTKVFLSSKAVEKMINDTYTLNIKACQFFVPSLEIYDLLNFVLIGHILLQCVFS